MYKKRKKNYEILDITHYPRYNRSNLSQTHR